jgi:hypothetical protein
MKDEAKGCGKGSLVAMWGVPLQPCGHANIMHARTVMSSAPTETMAGKLLPRVMDADINMTVPIDNRILGRLEQQKLREQVRTAVSTNPQPDLGADADLPDIIEKSDLLNALITGTKPQLAEELAMVVKSACSEAGRNVCQQFDAAVAKAPSKVGVAIKDLIDAVSRMDHSKRSNSQALGQFEKRIKQVKIVPQVKGRVKDTAFEGLKSHLVQKGQSEYAEALKEWTMDRFEDYWKAECGSVRERCERFAQDSNAYRTKIRTCEQECSTRLDRTQERLTTLKAGNQVVLQEASEDEFLATLMASRKVGGQTELIEGLRHDLEQRLRELAEQKGMGQQNAQHMPFRALVLAVPAADIVDAFVGLLTKSTSGSNSFYQACQAYSPKRLVQELSSRSRITSWFDGRDEPRFGITRFDLKMVRLPKATTQKEVEIREILEGLFQGEGFHDILDNAEARSISALRTYAGWPIGIEGGNPVLLEAYKKSAQTGHLPHLVGILPDTKAGEHAPGLMRL